MICPLEDGLPGHTTEAAEAKASMFPVCVRAVTTAGNKHILSLYTAFILFPVQKSQLTQDAAWRLIFPTCWSHSEGCIAQGSFTARFTTFQDVSFPFHLLSSFTALSCRFRAVLRSRFPGQLCPSASAISHLHQQEITIRGQPTNAFLRCGLLVAGGGCVSEPPASELSVLGPSRARLEVSQRTRSILSLRSHYSDFQWHQFDL